MQHSDLQIDQLRTKFPTALLENYVYTHNDHDPVGTHGLWSQFRNNSLQIVQWIARNVLCVPLWVKSQRRERFAVVLRQQSAADAFLIKNATRALLLIPPAFHKRRKQNQLMQLVFWLRELLHSRLAQKATHTQWWCDDGAAWKSAHRQCAERETSLPLPDVRGGSVYLLIIQLRLRYQWFTMDPSKWLVNFKHWSFASELKKCKFDCLLFYMYLLYLFYCFFQKNLAFSH